MLSSRVISLISGLESQDHVPSSLYNHHYHLTHHYLYHPYHHHPYPFHLHPFHHCYEFPQTYSIRRNLLHVSVATFISVHEGEAVSFELSDSF